MGLGVLRLGRHQVAILNKEAFKQPPGEGASCKGHGVEVCLMYSRKKEASIVIQGWKMGREVGNEQEKA